MLYASLLGFICLGPLFLLAANHIFHITLNEDEMTYHIKYKLLISCDECNTILTDTYFSYTFFEQYCIEHSNYVVFFKTKQNKRQKLRYCDTLCVVVSVVILCMINNIKSANIKFLYILPAQNDWKPIVLGLSACLFV